MVDQADVEQRIVRKIMEFFVIKSGYYTEVEANPVKAAMFFTMARILELAFPEYLKGYAVQKAMEEVEKIIDPEEKRQMMEKMKPVFDKARADGELPEGVTLN